MFDVLIAEDEPTITETLAFLLERAGWSVSAIADGAAVIAAMRQRRPRVLILDIMLPGRSGHDILRQVRSEPDLSAIRVLVLTARGHSHDRQLALELGADGFISKPFAIESVLEELRRLMGETPAKAQLA